MKIRFVFLFLLFLGCAHGKAVAPSPETPAEAESERDALLARAPASYRYVHQVVARYGPKTFVMTGYFLVQANGDFSVSGMAPVGPKLFDVAKTGGVWSAKAYVEEISKRLDVTNVGRAVERIYLVHANGRLTWNGTDWSSRAPVAGDEEVDAVETFRAPKTMTITRQRYFKHEKPVLDIHYDQPEQLAGQTITRHVRFDDARGFNLELSVTDYKALGDGLL